MNDNLFSTVIGWVGTAISGATNFFQAFFTGKFALFFISMFVVYLVGRSLLLPIIGGRGIRGSDKARSRDVSDPTNWDSGIKF